MLEKSIIEILKYTTMEQKEVLLEILEFLRSNYNSSANTNKSATMTVLECSEYMNVSKEKIRELIYKVDTDFPYFKVGTKVLINKIKLNEWLSKISLEHREL
jgi:excisionase family DNA binding protein